MFRSVAHAYRDAFSGLPRGPWILAGVCFVHRSGTMVLPFLALYLTSERGFSPREAGLVLTLYGVGSGLGSYFGGGLTDRFGAHRVQAASLLLAGVGLYVLGRLEDPVTIRWAVPLVAIALETFRPANATAFTLQSPPDRWTQAFAVRRLAINLGMTVGPAVGGLLAARDYHLLFVVDGITCWVAATVLLIADRGGRAAVPRAAAAGAAGADAAPARSPWRDGPHLALLGMTFLLNVVFLQVLSTYPLALHDLQRFTEPMIGSVYAINTTIIVLVEMVLVRRLALARPLGVARWGSLLLCGGFALLPWGDGYAYVAATVVVWTAGEMLTMPFFETVVAGRSEDRSRGRYLGSYNLAHALAFGAAPLMGTLVYERFGSLTLWTACGVTGALVWLGLKVVEPWLAATTSRPAPAAVPRAAVEDAAP